MQPPTWDAEQYRQRYAFVFHSSQDLVRDWLAPQPGERVLDLGCGTGELSAQMAASGAEVLGIDSVASMIGAARSSHPGVRFEVQDTRQLAFRQECSAVFRSSTSAWIFFVRFLLFCTRGLGMTGTRLLNGVREGTKVVPARRDMHRLTQGRLDPIHDLLAGPFPVVAWR